MYYDLRAFGFSDVFDGSRGWEQVRRALFGFGDSQREVQVSVLAADALGARNGDDH